MNEVPETRDSLLVRVADPQDRDAWEQFARIYRPVVYRLARGRGLQDADAQDLAQKVLISVARAIANWRRDDHGGRFRHWLRRVAKNAAINALSRRPPDQPAGGSEANAMLDQHQDLHTASEIDLEYKRQLYRHAADIVRKRADETTWLAFSLTMVDGETIAGAAATLNRTEAVVYAARSRIMRRLRDVIRQLEEEE